MIDAVPPGCLWDLGKSTIRGASTGDPTDEVSDVVVVGAGFTGLWTALYLSELEPTLSVTVLESHHVGFGASGRNGGWSSALLPMSTASLAREHGRERTLAFERAMKEAIDEIISRAMSWGIGDTVAKGGYVQLARSVSQEARLLETLEEARAWGTTEDDLRYLDVSEAGSLVNASDCRGALFTPHCAAIHPGALVRALGEEAVRRGVRIHEGVEVLAIESGSVLTDRGPMVAPISVRATEAFTTRLRGSRRRVLPLYSMMVATEPIDRNLLDRIIDPRRPTFNDARHLIVYGQRTADDRIAFGGRGAPYHFGSKIHESFDHHQETARHLVESVRDFFPELKHTGFTHHWGGPLGAPRDWTCSVAFDPRSGLGHAGGYVGDGVTTANLAGRTLADLIVGRSTDLTGLPWVGHRSRSWEPEPLRWIAVNAMARLAGFADRREERTGRRAVNVERLLDLVLGH